MSGLTKTSTQWGGRLRSLGVLFFSLSLAPLYGGEQEPEKMKLLIVDGQNNHDWKTTTPRLKEILEESKRFEVAVATTPAKGSPLAAWDAFKPNFKSYDVVLLNYFGQDWPGDRLQQLTNYVEKGGGFVALHAAVAPFKKDKAFNDMIALGWRKATFGKRIYLDENKKVVVVEKGIGLGAGHAKLGEVSVDVCNCHHPIVEGFEASWSHGLDEVYHGQRGPAQNMTVLATAISATSEKNEPIIWTVKYGEGRSFVTLLGHDLRGMKSQGFKASLQRGCEWAASGQVKTPLPVSSGKSDSRGKLPSWDTIKEYQDTSIDVYGRYAAVKLPLVHGVGIWNPVAIEEGPDGLIYVANYTGEILSLHDSDGDGLEDTAKLFVDIKKYKDEKGAPLRYPTSMAWKGKELYVGTTQEIRVFSDTNGDGKSDKSRVFFKDFPWTMHVYDWTFGLKFGPDGFAYVIFCTDYLNQKPAKDPKGYRGSIVRIAPDGKTSEVYANGLRFAYDLEFNQHGDMFFSDNKGGHQNISDEFNHVVKGAFYGHNPEKFPGHSEPVRPIVDIKYGYGPVGLAFNPVANDFDGTGGNIFLANWGPDGKFDRGSINRFKLEKQGKSYRATEYLVAKWIAKLSDLTFSSEGDMYVTRFGRENRGHRPWSEPEGDVYRFIEAPWVIPKKTEIAPLVIGSIKKGEKIFQSRACFSCHSIDDNAKNMLGPGLDGVGEMFDRNEMLVAINEPSRGIKSGHETLQVTLKDGTVIVGRMLRVSPEELVLLIAGNQEYKVASADVLKTVELETSLMPAGLLTGLSKADINDLLAYMKVRESVKARDSHNVKNRDGSGGGLDVLSLTNLALDASASSEGKVVGASGGPEAAIDGDGNTFWGEADDLPNYRLKLDFEAAQTVSAIRIFPYNAKNAAPKDFDIMIDGKLVKQVKDARYRHNELVVTFPEVSCKSLEINIKEAYGKSPAIREVGVYHIVDDAE